MIVVGAEKRQSANYRCLCWVLVLEAQVVCKVVRQLLGLQNLEQEIRFGNQHVQVPSGSHHGHKCCLLASNMFFFRGEYFWYHQLRIEKDKDGREYANLRY